MCVCIVSREEEFIIISLHLVRQHHFYNAVNAFAEINISWDQTQNIRNKTNGKPSLISHFKVMNVYPLRIALGLIKINEKSLWNDSSANFQLSFSVLCFHRQLHRTVWAAEKHKHTDREKGMGVTTTQTETTICYLKFNIDVVLRPRPHLLCFEKTIHIIHTTHIYNIQYSSLHAPDIVRDFYFIMQQNDCSHSFVLVERILTFYKN